MIRTVAEFLEEFKEAGISQIEQRASDVTHRPTIGNIYEGLTKELLDRAIFEGFNLKIMKNCFIQNSFGEMSNEIDVMIVSGEGDKLPYTDQFVFTPAQVIAVVQVKKRLYKNDILSSYHNLKSVCAINEARDVDKYVTHLQRDAYRILVGKELPSRADIEKKSEREQLFFHSLLMEAFHPLRIVLGFFGYATEHSLREGFVTMLEDQLKDTKTPVKGFGPFSFPNLIICENAAIIKSVGMPIGTPFQQSKHYWNVLLSSPSNPMYYLLELIWCRLSYIYEIPPDIFGADFDKQTLHRFISCSERKISEEEIGWEFYYNDFSPEQLAVPLVDEPFAPYEVNDVQQEILFWVTRQGSINIEENQKFHAFLTENEYPLDRLIAELQESRLVYLEDNQLLPLVDQIVFVNTPDGKIVAGENRSGELYYWIEKHYNSNNRN